MQCHKVRDQLITGYADKELSPEETAEVEKHLTGCTECRGFLKAVQQNAITPFKESEEIQPDDVVWQKIRLRIESEKAGSQGWLAKLADALAPLMKVPQPVFRGAFATALVLTVILLANWPSRYADPVYGYLTEQMTFMGELKAGNTDLMNGDFKDFDAAFEIY